MIGNGFQNRFFFFRAQRKISQNFPGGEGAGARVIFLPPAQIMKESGELCQNDPFPPRRIFQG